MAGTGAKNRILSIIDRSDYLIRPKWKVNAWLHAELLKHLITAHNIDCVIDGGTNRGQFRDFLRSEVAFAGLIFSFEPVRHLFEFCEIRAKDDSAWRLFEIALGAEDTEMPINVTRNDDLSSLLRPLSAQPFSNETDVVGVEKVKVDALDNLLPQLQSGYHFRNVFLKLDTQGFDLTVIGGARKSLECVRIIQSELSVMPIYEGMPTWIEGILAFQELGYEISGLYPVNRDRHARIIEFDGVFVKAPSLGCG